jgi:hypothetical protein
MQELLEFQKSNKFPQWKFLRRRSRVEPDEVELYERPIVV